MDAVELGRQAAAALHEKAVEAGDDPWSPYAFAKAEAERRNIDVEETSPGSSQLDGGRAFFDPIDRLIVIEDAGTDFDKAFLVAHEIGHVVLGDDEDRGTGTIDPARAAEPTPMGFDRVVDYGRRQRREVQMDLFAREFLLPRKVLAKLHVEDGIGASAIAGKVGAPFDVVAQQLMDALLLPEIASVAEAAQPAEDLNDQQLAAIDHRGAAYLLEAGPGTGKTRTLVARVDDLLRTEEVDPRSVLLLTFSNKAAQKLAGRIAARCGDAAAAVTITTFHAFGLDLVRRFHAEMGMPTEPRMMDRTEAVELLEDGFARLDLRHHRDIHDPTDVIVDMLTAVSRAKDEVVDHRAYAQLARTMADDAKTPEAVLAAEAADEVARFYSSYESLKRERGAIDFGDLVILPVTLLEGNEAIRTSLRNRYGHILVDEYQDVNRASVRLLKALAGGGENLWAVGDSRQSIYRFRGASSFNMTRFGEDFAGACGGRLEINYRSVDEVVTAFNEFAREMKAGGEDAGLRAYRGRGDHAPQFVTADTAEQEIVVLADTIEAMRKQGCAFRDQAVLSTGNEKLAKLGRGLEALGIPVLFLGSLFERPEVKDLVAFLSMLVDRRATGLLRAGRVTGVEMPLGDIAVMIDRLRGESGEPGSWMRDLVRITGLSDGGSNALRVVAETLEGFGQTSAPWTVLATVILDRARMGAAIASSNDPKDRARGIATWQFMNFVRSQPSGQGLPIARLLDRIRRLLRLGDDRDLRELPAAAASLDAVRIMTIHGAKGLEFEAVHVPGLNADTIPLRTARKPRCPPPDGMIDGTRASADAAFQTSHAEEQECLFYVAISRARDRLVLYAPTKTRSGAKRAESGFIGRLGSGVVRRHADPERQKPESPEDGRIDIVVEGTLAYDASQIPLYESCARRFFYTHVLRIGGRRTTTAFMRMHEATRAVLNLVRDARSPPGDLERQVEEALYAEGLGDHGHLDDYKTIAISLLRYHATTRDGLVPEAPSVLKVAFGMAEITATADDVLVEPGGRRILRRVRTGHMRSKESKDLGAAAFLAAVRGTFPAAGVELVHLADATRTPLAFSDVELRNRTAKIVDILVKIGKGEFPTETSARRCPACPAFFVCGPVPAGAIRQPA